MSAENQNFPLGSDVLDDYSHILEFVRKHNGIDVIRFDYYTVREVALFAVYENFDFEEAEQVSEAILRELPAIKRIFAKPIIHLKDSFDILPVEAVRKVNSKTVTHAALHSELWENKDAFGVRPRKLLTVNNQDDYAIYENIVFSHLIDRIMTYLRRNISILRRLLYAKSSLSFHLLDRTNHLNYYLAIGKLHTGYTRNYNAYSESAERCLAQLNYIYNVINARLQRPVYKKCRGFDRNFTLKSTNILRMHKDYHRIYLLLKYLSSVEASEKTEPVVPAYEGYFEFCVMLLIFAVTNFGFTCDESAKINFLCPDVIFRYSSVSLHLRTLTTGEGKRALSLDFDGGKSYRICLIPCDKGSLSKEAEGIDGQKAGVGLPARTFEDDADECVFLCPDDDEQSVLVSISDIESFRRIQQIVERGMIYADTQKSDCPFCGQKLVRSEDPTTNMPLYECRTCRTVIKEQACPETGKGYFVTDIKNYIPDLQLQKTLSAKDREEYHRQLEAAYHFRNITKYNGAGFVCPHCGKVHSL